MIATTMRRLGGGTVPTLHSLAPAGTDSGWPPFDDVRGFEPPVAAPRQPVAHAADPAIEATETDALPDDTDPVALDADLGLAGDGHAAGIDVHAPLVQRIVYQDEAAMADLYRALSGRVWRLALRLTQHAPTAEEVVEDVFWQVWRQAPRFDATRGVVLAWVLLITRSRSLDALRAARRNPLHAAEGWADEDEDRIPAGDTAIDDPRDLCDSVQRASQVQAALRALDPLRRQLVSLAFLRGCTQAEIAEHTGLPLGTVKSHLKRALATMKAALEAPSAAAATRSTRTA